MIDVKTIAEWREAAKKATPGPWVHPDDEKHLLRTDKKKPYWQEDTIINDDEAEDDDMQFIALACNNFLLLLDEVERLQKLCEPSKQVRIWVD